MRITATGQVTIPARVREQLGLQPGTEVTVEVVGDALQIRRSAVRADGETPAGAAPRGKPTRRMSSDELLGLTGDDEVAS